MSKKEYTHKNNCGSLFKNDQGGNTNRPIYKGTINIEGTLYAIDAWDNTGKSSGKKYIGLTVQLPYKKEEQSQSSKSRSVKVDELPF